MPRAKAAPKRVLVLCGSYHPGSSNRAALDRVIEPLAQMPEVRIVESVGLDGLPALDARQLEAPPESVRRLREQLAEASAILIAGPEYAGGLAGSLKNALDWCVGAIEGFYGKPVAVLSAGTTGGRHALHQLIRTLLWQGAHVVGQLGLAAPRTKSDADGRLVDPPTVAALHALGAALADSVDLDPETRARRSGSIAREVGIDDDPHRR